MQTNIRALEQRQPGSEHLRRYGETARMLTGNATATSGDCVPWARKLVADLSIPNLRRYGIASCHITELVEKASKANSMKANPIVLTPEELARTLEAAM